MGNLYERLGNRTTLTAIVLAGVMAVVCLVFVASRIAAEQEANRITHAQEVKANADNSEAIRQRMAVLFSGKGW